MPKKGYPYVIGGDTAEGGLDYCVGQVLDNTTGRQVAKWRGHTDTDLYAKQMFSLGWFYNEALIAVEMNFDLHPTKELERLGYHKQYIRETLDDISKTKQHKHGWRTSPASRGPLIGDLVAVVRDDVDLVTDIETLDEMLTFVRNEVGKPEAQQGKFDDCVLSLAIAHKARDQQSTRVAKDEGWKPTPRGTYTVAELKYKHGMSDSAIRRLQRQGGYNIIGKV